MPTQKFTQQDIDQLSLWFQRRYESQFAWKSACSTYEVLPLLRGFWPMSAVAYTNPQVIDQSGNGLHLTNNNSTDFGYTNLIPWAEFNGITETMSYADTGAGGAFDIIGNEVYIDGTARGLTAYAWVRFANAAAAAEYIIAKWLVAGGQKSYRLIRNAAGNAEATITTDGVTNFTIASTQAIAATTWYCLAMQYDPSTKLSVWVNGVETSNAVAVPATIFDSTANFYLGADSTPGNLMAGRQSLVALCASCHADTTIISVFNQTKAMFGIR